ncbi:S9 family peptidase [Puteibacter caeruleilacunae]|nr:S9 family peptidase [Puteibacter caeruleilacunae]
MNKVLLFFLILTAFAGQTIAQSHVMTLEDALINRYYHLSPDDIWQLQWRKGSNEQYTYAVKDYIIQKTAGKKDSTALVCLKDVNNALQTNKLNTLSTWRRYHWEDNNTLSFNVNNSIVLYNVSTKTIDQVISMPAESNNTDFSYVGKMAAYTIDNNLYVANAVDKKIKIAADENQYIVYGQSVHRNEFGIMKGTYWSPKGNFLAFYRKDETMVHSYPLVDYMTREAEPAPIKYPMAGLTSHQVTIGIYDVDSKKTIFLNTGNPDDHYLTNIAWGPQEKYLYIQELNREQNHMKLNKYDAHSGEFVATLFEETRDTYVEPQHPIKFSKVNPEEFYYWSRKNDYYHIYKFNTSGKLVKQLTDGKWEVTSMLGFDAKERNLFVTTTKDSPLERQLYKVDTRTGKMAKLTSGEGIHNSMLSPQAGYILDKFQGSNIPRIIDLIKVKNLTRENLLTAKNPLANYTIGENKLVTLKSDDGQDLYGRLILPTNFDASKKYPVIVYVYGGPHSQLVNKGWLNQARWWQYFMAEKGYIAFTLDNRGTNNRGQKFEDAIHRNLGIAETSDQMKGVEYLKSLPYVDQDRIGVHGWSYGGFMTLNLVLRHPEVFKVGVAGGPVVDWSMYEVMYGERYMDMPKENNDGYNLTNMAKLTNKLDSKLMLIHGVQDPTVVMQHSFKFIRSCIENGKQVDFFPYPTHEHNVRGTDRLHLMQKVSDYFDANL